MFLSTVNNTGNYNNICSPTEPPVLRREPVTAVVNSTFSFNMEQSAGYPPVPTFEWFLNAIKISNSSINPIMTVYPQIVFSPVLRSQSGSYSMTASTEGGDSTG